MSRTSRLASVLPVDTHLHSACRSLGRQFVSHPELSNQRRYRHHSSESHSSADSDRRNHNYVNCTASSPRPPPPPLPLRDNHHIRHSDQRSTDGQLSDSSCSRSPRNNQGSHRVLNELRCGSHQGSGGGGVRSGGQYRCRVEADVLVVREDTSSGSSCGYQDSVRSTYSSHHHHPHHQQQQRVDNSQTASLNTMYLETKSNMLRMVEQSLQLRLELQSLQGSFFDLLHNFKRYENLAPPPSLTQPVAVEKPLQRSSSARMRVRALYEARRSRILARHGHADLKENRAPPEVKSRLVRPEASDVNTSTPVVPQRNRRTSVNMNASKLPLTPICEEDGEKSTRLGVVKLVDDDDDDDDIQVSDIEGEYVTLKDDCLSPNAFSGCVGTSIGNHNDASHWANASLFSNRITSNHTNRLSSSPRLDSATSPSRSLRSSPAQFASCSAISELYTASSTKDLSIISQESRCSLREQPSSSSMSEHFHSTFQYPLHSTMNYPLHSTLGPLQGTVSNVSPGHRSDDEALNSDDLELRSLDTRTVMSEPISYKKIGISSIADSRPFSSTHSVDDYVNASRARQVMLDKNHNESKQVQPTCNENDNYNESDFKTPTRKPQATLCKEHGLHPTFGGPCIFQTDDSMTMLSSSSSDFSDAEVDNGTGERVTRRNSSRDTDCDSSYLSECVDDSHTSQGYSESEEYTAMYDQRNARMRILRRQTGHSELTSGPRYPIGLSESDIFHDVTHKHLSLQATRASLPDLSGLSTVPTSEMDEDFSESTLMATPPCDVTMRSYTSACPDARVSGHYRSSEGLHSANSTLVLDDLDCPVPANDVNADGGDQRPLSISTATTDESPESNNGLSVPVNSPNITDSGGSSSRPTTDSYDYVDVPGRTTAWTLPASQHPTPAQPVPTSSRPPCTVGKIPTPHDVRSRSSRRSRSSSRPRVTASSPSSGRSRGARSLDLHCVARPSRRGRSSGGRTPELDSGFSTQGSCWRGGHGNRNRMQKHIDIVDASGMKRTVIQHNAVAKNLQHDRKKALVKKLKRFNNNFYRVNSTGNLHIETLGHF